MTDLRPTAFHGPLWDISADADHCGLASSFRTLVLGGKNKKRRKNWICQTIVLNRLSEVTHPPYEFFLSVSLFLVDFAIPFSSATDAFFDAPVTTIAEPFTPPASTEIAEPLQDLHLAICRIQSILHQLLGPSKRGTYT